MVKSCFKVFVVCAVLCSSLSAYAQDEFNVSNLDVSGSTKVVPSVVVPAQSGVYLQDIYTDHNMKLEEVIQKLDSAQSSLGVSRQNVQLKLEEVNRDLKVVMDRKKAITNQLKTLNAEDKAITKMKTQIRNNIKKNERLNGVG